jgi:hypothetical protein
MNVQSALVFAALAFGAANTAHASLVLLNQSPFSGAGLGAMNTILTVTSPGNSTTESGCVAFGNTVGPAACLAGVASGGNEMTGTSQTQTRTIAQAGATSAANFAIVLNAVEPGGNSITVDNLAVRFYSTAGATLYTASLAAPVTLANTLTGIGNAGFVFVLDPGQAAAAQAAGAFTNTANIIGLFASLSAATGGPETFFVGNLGTNVVGGVGSPIPEPTTYLTLGAGLIAIGTLRKRLTR